MCVAPKVSVIVPVYNAGEYLLLSVESIINQTLKDIEIILVNDGSTDSSGLVIDSLAQDNGNIVNVHLPENRGVHEARLAGLRKAKGDFIGFMDADDYVRPHMYERLSKILAEIDADIAICGYDRVSRDRKLIKKKLHFNVNEKIEFDVFEQFCAFKFGAGSLCNKLYRRRVIEPWFDMSFPWRQSINEDLLLNIGCFYMAETVYLCNEEFYEYVENRDSVTSNMNNIKAYVDTYRAFALALSCFSKLGDEVALSIVDMYRAQLSENGYLIDSSRLLSDHKMALEEAVNLIFRCYPAALALLAARRKVPQTNCKIKIKVITWRILVFFGVDPLVVRRVF